MKAPSQPLLHPYLAPYQWERRLLLLFSPTENNRLYRAQLAEWNEHETELLERELMLIRVLGDKALNVKERDMNAETAQSLRRHYQIPEKEAVVLLIGKDGLEQLRTRDLLTADRILRTLEAGSFRMPEIKKGNKKLL